MILQNSAKVMLRNRCYKHVENLQPGEKVMCKTKTQMDSYAMINRVEPLQFPIAYKSFKTNMWHSHVYFAPTHKLLLKSGGHKRAEELLEGESLLTPYYKNITIGYTELEYDYGYIIGTLIYSGYCVDEKIVIYFEKEDVLKKFKRAWASVYSECTLIDTKPASVYKVVIEPSPISVKRGEIIEKYCSESAEFARGVIDAYKENIIVNASQELYELYVWASSFSGATNHRVLSVNSVQIPQSSTLIILEVDTSQEDLYLCVNNSLLLF
jgi:hypothetical protein